MKFNKHFPEFTRYVIAILFFYFVFAKILTLWTNGMTPYITYVKQIGLPRQAGYYIIIALVIEIILAVGIWYNKSFDRSIYLGVLLVGSGIIFSIISLTYKFNSDCGCGLLGENEYGFMAQKIAILVIMLYLLRIKKQLFESEK